MSTRMRHRHIYVSILCIYIYILYICVRLQRLATLCRCHLGPYDSALCVDVYEQVGLELEMRSCGRACVQNRNSIGERPGKLVFGNKEGPTFCRLPSRRLNIRPKAPILIDTFIMSSSSRPSPSPSSSSSSSVHFSHAHRSVIQKSARAHMRTRGRFF